MPELSNFHLLTDTHCHLNLEIFKEDFADVLKRAWDVGIDRILIPAINLLGSQEIANLCDAHPNLYMAVGVHPNEALTWTENTLKSLSDLAKHPKVVAIGEIGLDYYRKVVPIPLQQKILASQLELASHHNLPVVLHNRNAFNDLWNFVNDWHIQLEKEKSKTYSQPGVFHSFSEDAGTMEKVVSRNFFIGVSGPVTYKNALLIKNVASSVPIDRILVETDAPYLTPEPHRGQRNEPSNIIYIIDKVSQIIGISSDQLAMQTSKNADKLFGWR